MKIVWTWLTVACLGATAVAEPAGQRDAGKKPGPTAADWKVFDDPAALLLTDPFAASINRLPAAEK